MKAPNVITVDFETEEVANRPCYPPKPVGFSIKWPKDRKAKYWAWGHPTGNNTDYQNAQRKLQEAWCSDLPILFHHAKFDLEVAEVHMGCKRLPWERVHDTMFLLFLHDPHADTLGLKPASESILGMPPEERDALNEYIIETFKASKKSTGAYISRAPGDLVGEYANGDVTRTLALFNKLYPEIVERGMLEAYNRELKCMYIFIDNERIGINVDVDKLESDIKLYNKHLLTVENWLTKKLGDINFDSNTELANALDKNGVVTDWVLTKSGKKSTEKKNMTIDVFKDLKIFTALGYRGRLCTCLNTFMNPWLNQAKSTNGTINTSWNQVRQNKDDKSTKGTRTGRPSSMVPNFLNIPKSFEDKNDGYTHPSFIRSIDALPLVRKYLLPDKNSVWLHRDYNQQEVRILAHFEDDILLRAFQNDPKLDIHSLVQQQIKDIIGKEIPRGPIKILNFGRIYGEGVGSMAERMRMSVDEVKPLRNAQNRALPGLPELEKQVKAAVRNGGTITTWGGRQYAVEEPKYSKKYDKVMSFEYKMLNYLIQGSAADCTKEALIRYNELKKDSRFLVTVYDEVNISAPTKAVKKEMKALRTAMESVEFDVLMRSDGKFGPNWGTLDKYEEK